MIHSPITKDLTKSRRKQDKTNVDLYQLIRHRGRLRYQLIVNTKHAITKIRLPTSKCMKNNIFLKIFKPYNDGIS